MTDKLRAAAEAARNGRADQGGVAVSKKASNCYECRNWRVGDFGTPECLKGHKPRFYAPTTMRAALLGDWGMKRRCKDFRGANDAPAE